MVLWFWAFAIPIFWVDSLNFLVFPLGDSAGNSSFPMLFGLPISVDALAGSRCIFAFFLFTFSWGVKG